MRRCWLLVVGAVLIVSAHGSASAESAGTTSMIIRMPEMVIVRYADQIELSFEQEAIDAIPADQRSTVPVTIRNAWSVRSVGSISSPYTTVRIHRADYSTLYGESGETVQINTADVAAAGNEFDGDSVDRFIPTGPGSQRTGSIRYSMDLTAVQSGIYRSTGPQFVLTVSNT